MPAPITTRLAAALGFVGTLGSAPACYHWVVRGPTAVREAEVEHAAQVMVTRLDGTVVSGRIADLDPEVLRVTVWNDVVEVPVEEIARLELYRLDVAATTVGVLVLAAAVPVAIELAPALSTLGTVGASSKAASCPFVYVWPMEGDPLLVGEAYPGAVVGALERDDLLALPDLGTAPATFRLASEAHEVHHTDVAELWELRPPSGTRAVAMADASVALAGEPMPLRSATDLAGNERTAALARADGVSWSTDMAEAVTRTPGPRVEGLELVFGPPGAAPVLLELDLANTAWTDAVTAQVWAAMGDRRPDLQARWAHDTAGLGERLRTWRRRAGLELRVEVRQGGPWVEVGSIPPPGWIATRHLGVALGPGLDPDTDLEVRLTGGVGFWRVDAAGMAVLVDPEPPVWVHRPAWARSWTGADERTPLGVRDGVRQVLPDAKTWVDIGFTPDPSPGVPPSTWFLSTRGYYEVLGQHPGPPEWARLAGLATRPERLGAVSLDLWRAVPARWRHVTVSIIEEPPP